jgi:hypothetical protein
MKNALLLALALGFASACGVNAVGQKCTTNADCALTYTCFLQVAGGFCSKGCSTPGKNDECPKDSACAQVANNTLVCSPECTDDSQCGTGLKCLSVSGSSDKACGMP